MTEHQHDDERSDPDEQHDQDAEPTLRAPEPDRPDGLDADEGEQEDRS